MPVMPIFGKITKRGTIEKSKLLFFTPKIISVIPYSYNYLVSYPISLKLFCQLFLISKTPYRASLIRSMYRPMPVINVCFTFKNKKERETYSHEMRPTLQLNSFYRKACAASKIKSLTGLVCVPLPHWPKL